jgi:MFS family permease
VIRAVLHNRGLRRVLLAYVGFNAAEYAVWLAMLVYAYRQGGTTTAGLVAVIQLAPAAVFAPFAAGLADRHPPARVLAIGYAVQGVAMGGTAVVILAGAPAPLAYACAAVAATAVTITRPTQAVLTPALAHTAEELTATNVVSGWVENGSIMVATALTGVILSVSGPGAVFLLCAAIALIAAALVARVAGPAAVLDGGDAGPFDEAVAGFRTLAQHAEPRMIVGLLGLESVIFGALDLLFVVLALNLLSVGSGWVGYFNAVFSAGGVVGAAATVMLVGRRHMAPAIITGLFVWGVTFIAIAGSATLGVAVAMLIVGGAARALFDVAAKTLLQRISPADVLGRVFGVLEGTSMAGMAVGQLLVAGLVALTSPTAALVGVGILLVLATLLAIRRLVAIDRGARVPIVEISLLRSIPLFHALPPPAVEGIAHALQSFDATDGQEIISQGDVGDCYYAIVDGTVCVSRNGREVAVLGRAEGFGEIALLKDVPRTASVTAVGPVRLQTLDKDSFITALTGHTPALHHAETIVTTRRDELRAVDSESA